MRGPRPASDGNGTESGRTLSSRLASPAGGRVRPENWCEEGERRTRGAGEQISASTAEGRDEGTVLGGFVWYWRGGQPGRIGGRSGIPGSWARLWRLGSFGAGAGAGRGFGVWLVRSAHTLGACLHTYITWRVICGILRIGARPCASEELRERVGRGRGGSRPIWQAPAARALRIARKSDEKAGSPSSRRPIGATQRSPAPLFRLRGDEKARSLAA